MLIFIVISAECSGESPGLDKAGCFACLARGGYSHEPLLRVEPTRLGGENCFSISMNKGSVLTLP